MRPCDATTTGKLRGQRLLVDDLLRMGWIRGFSRGTLQITLAVLALLIGLRVALPHIVKKYVNKKLDEMPEYDGRIGDVDMHLWMGAYSIQDIEIIKTDGKVPVPFFDAKRVTFSLEWKALFDGALVGEIDFYDPVMNFVQGLTRKSSQVGVDKPWLDVIKKLFPLDIKSFCSSQRHGSLPGLPQQTEG